MPDQKAAPQIQEVDLASLPLLKEKIDTQEALSLVNQTFSAYEAYRTNSHDTRWMEHDQLYAGWLKEKYWPGTKTPRSNVSYQLTFDQIESALPAIMAALFNNGDDWFEVVAQDNLPPSEARKIRDSLNYCFENPKNDFGGTIRNEITLAVKQVLQHGNGAVCCFFDPTKNKEIVEWVDLRDLYFDPGACTPAVEESRAIIRRKKFTVNDILALKEDPRFKIPSEEVLWGLAANMTSRYADNTKSQSEAMRHVNYNPGSSDYTPNPADSFVEVLIYESQTRIIWVVNGQWVLFNGTNPYNMIMTCVAPCYTYLGRFYAQSISDVQGHNQRVIEGLVNGHRDNMALALHPPRVSPRGALTTPSEQRFGPGVDMKVDDPSKDVAMLYPQGGLVNIYPDVQFFQTAAETRTGITGLGSGMPRPSNANRTLGGMQMQAGGSANRLSSIVQNIEDYMLVPLLYKLYRLKQFHTHPQESVAARSNEGQNYQVEGSIFNNKVHFKMQAASRMMTRDKLLQMVPMLAQYTMQGPLLEQMHRVGFTLDMPEFWEMVMEATGIKGRFQLFRKMDQQEMQMVQQTSPSVVEQQRVQQESQTKLQLEQMRGQTELQKAQIAKQSNPQELQMEMQMKQQEMEMKKQESEAKIFAEMVMNKIKIAAAKEKAQLDLEVTRHKTRAKAEDTMVQAQVNQAAGQQDLQTGQMKHQFAMQQMIEQAKAKKEAARIAPQKSAGVGPSSPKGKTDPGKKEKTKS